MTIDSFTCSFHKYLMHFYRRPCGSSSFGSRPRCNSWKGGNHCLRVAPCREPNDKLSLVAFEHFTTLGVLAAESLQRKLPGYFINDKTVLGNKITARDDDRGVGVTL